MSEPAHLPTLAQQVLVHTYNRPSVVFTHGQGSTLYDTAGQPYLDFTAGIAVNALGHAHPAWVAAVQAAAARLTHVSNLYHTVPHIELAARLVDLSFAHRVFFANSGSEANEGALKFARKWARTTHGPHKTGLVAFGHGFHGRTMGALSVTEKPRYREPFDPLVPGVRFGAFNDVVGLTGLIDDSTAAVIVEPVQGEGGVHPATPEFMQALRTACDAHNALLIVDEVQIGLGRSGKLWGHQHGGITPDIMTLAKPLANGLPIGAVLTTELVASAIEPGDHGSTFAGGPLVCAAANVVVDIVSQPGFLADVTRKSQHLRQRLHDLNSDAIIQIRGAGLLVGVELTRPAAPLVDAARTAGLLVLSAGENVLRLAPPLIVTEAEIDRAVAILAALL